MRTPALAFHLALGLLTFLPQVTLLEAAEARSSKSTPSSGEDLFAQPRVVKIQIQLPSGGQEALRKDPKEYVKATVRCGDVVLTNVGIRLKGQTTYQSIDKRPSLTLKFNEFVKGQELYGRTKVLLNTSIQDPTCIAAALAGEIFRAADVPAPKSIFARVDLNGRDLGLYSLTEAANKDFLSDYFKKTKGNLYEGDNNDILQKLEKDSGEGSDDQADLKALAAAAKETDPEKRWSRLAPLLDVNRFIAFAAVEVLTWHHDGYTIEHNNYRIYHDPGTGQMVFIVHGLDELFEKADAPLLPEWKGLVAKAVFTTAEGKKRYQDALAKITGSVFQGDAMVKRINELAGVVRPSLDPANVAAFDSAVAGLRERVTKRAAYAGQQVKTLSSAK